MLFILSDVASDMFGSLLSGTDRAGKGVGLPGSID
jgi:hypothetical protein